MASSHRQAVNSDFVYQDSILYRTRLQIDVVFSFSIEVGPYALSIFIVGVFCVFQIISHFLHQLTQNGKA